MKFILAIFILSSPFLLASSHLISISETVPHSKTCYSQGLFFLNSTHLFQSCGLYNESHFRLSTYHSSPFQLQEVFISEKPWRREVFLEGATLFNGFIYLLTWRQHIVYLINPENLEEVERMEWEKDGWGITQNGTHLFVSDGSDKIYLVEKGMKIVEEKRIKDLKGRKLSRINELEYVDGYIYCNIYLQRKIMKIKYEEGRVIEEYDGLNLLKNQKGLEYGEALNGIAYNSQSQKFLLTGKNWASFYQIIL